MQDNWEKIPLGELFEFGSGLSKPRADFGSGFGFLSFKDVFYNYFVPDRLEQLVKSTEKEQKTCSVKRGDVFLTRTSETQEDLGMSCVALKDYERATFNGFTKRLRPKFPDRIVPEYAAYFFRSNLFRQDVTAMSSLSTRASLNNEMLGRLKMLLPPVEEQKAIGRILKSLDDKIELNRRMNATLEAMARALYKAWFVDFEPVHANLENRPSTSASPEIAKLFPSDFDNGIPKGWREGSIANLAKISKESVSPGKFPDEEFHHFSIPAFDDGKHPKKDLGSTILSNKFLVQRNAVLVSKLNPRIFRAWTVFPPKEGRCIASTEFIVYEARLGSHWSFLNSLLRSDEIISSFQQHVTGTSGSHQRVKPESTLNIPIVIPSEQVLDTFNEITAPTYSLLQLNIDQIQSLSQIRDSLLPRLISGKISVGEASVRYV